MENGRDDAGQDDRTRLARPNYQAREWGQGKNIFPCAGDHEHDWRPMPGSIRSLLELHNNIGCGKREVHIDWSMMTCKMAAPVTGTTLRTTGPVPADSRQWTSSVHNCVTQLAPDWPDGVWRFNI